MTLDMLKNGETAVIKTVGGARNCSSEHFQRTFGCQLPCVYASLYTVRSGCRNN